MIRQMQHVGQIRADQVEKFERGWVKTFMQTVRFPRSEREGFCNVVVDEVNRKPQLAEMKASVRFFNGCGGIG